MKYLSRSRIAFVFKSSFFMQNQVKTLLSPLNTAIPLSIFFGGKCRSISGWLRISTAWPCWAGWKKSSDEACLFWSTALSFGLFGQD